MLHRGNARRAAARIAAAGIEGERVPSLLLRLETAVIRKLEALPSSAPVAAQLVGSLADVREELEPDMGLTGREAVSAFLRAVGGRFLPDFPPLRSLARRYPEIEADRLSGRMWLRDRCPACGGERAERTPEGLSACPECGYAGRDRFAGGGRAGTEGGVRAEEGGARLSISPDGGGWGWSVSVPRRSGSAGDPGDALAELKRAADGLHVDLHRAAAALGDAFNAAFAWSPSTGTVRRPE